MIFESSLIFPNDVHLKAKVGKLTCSKECSLPVSEAVTVTTSQK